MIAFAGVVSPQRTLLNQAFENPMRRRRFDLEAPRYLHQPHPLSIVGGQLSKQREYTADPKSAGREGGLEFHLFASIYWKYILPVIL